MALRMVWNPEAIAKLLSTPEKERKRAAMLARVARAPRRGERDTFIPRNPVTHIIILEHRIDV